MKKRVLYSDNGTISDFSTSLNNYNSGSEALSLVAAEDAIYIGTTFPFNHTYLNLGAVKNVEASVVAVAHWDGNSFESMIEVIDETAVSGASLAQSGFMTWTPDRDNSWVREDTEEISDLSTVKIYDLYWTKLTFSADLTADVILSWCGQLFSDDDDLGSEYPDLVTSNFLTAIEAGKATYQEQHQRAADIIVNDLKARKMIGDGNQILDRDDLRLSSVSKVSELVYGMLGDDYVDNKKASRLEYTDRLSKSFVKADQNSDGRLSVSESRVKVRRLFR